LAQPENKAYLSVRFLDRFLDRSGVPLLVSCPYSSGASSLRPFPSSRSHLILDHFPPYLTCPLHARCSSRRRCSLSDLSPFLSEGLSLPCQRVSPNKSQI